MKQKDPLLIPIAIIVAIIVVYMLWIDYPGDDGPILIIPIPTPTIEPTPTIDTSLDWYCWRNPKSDKCIEFCKRVDCRE